jgi:Putative esterase
MEAAVAPLRKAVEGLPKETPRDLYADVAVYRKAADWVLRLEEFYEPKDVVTTLEAIDEGLRRTRLLDRGEHPWSEARGMVARGYVSKVDGSVQPYAVIVPEGLDLTRATRMRLDVVLHGRNATLSEVRFLASLGGKPTPSNPDALGKITLHVFGRPNNAYRWAGETDVFEAIDAVKRNYPIDERRIILRGFSMGGAGAWHLGLHHPSLWSSVEAGAGFTESKIYAKLKDLPTYQEKTLSIYDATDYALNAWNVPIAGYGGEDDPQLQASTNIVNGLKSLGFTLKTDGLQTRGEGIDFLRVVGAKMGHKVDPASAKVLKTWHDEHAVQGANLDPKRIRFTTYTVKYGKAAWLSIEAMHEHYKRAEVDAEIRGLKVIVSKLENVSVLAVNRHAGQTIVLGAGNEEFPLESAVKGLLPNVYFQATADGRWRVMDYNESRAFEENTERRRRKVRGVQGPIDDAFTGPFLCVKGTGEPWNPAIGRWSGSRLDQFASDWAKFLRGDVRVKSDTEVTPEDIENNHLILFGDPGSNRLIARVLEGLPISWSRTEMTLGGEKYTASDHVPVLIAPNPVNPRRYVVLNSGHTFGAREFSGTNALLFPRLGDYAVFQTDGRNSTVKASGFFDERWSMRAH